MQRLSVFLKRPIVTANSGEKLGDVAELLLDIPNRRLVGLVVANGLFAKEHVLLFTSVQTLGTDAVIAESASGLMSVADWRKSGIGAAKFTTLQGKQVVSSAGMRMGAVSDLMVNEETGCVDALEVAARDLGGLRTRHSLIPASAEVSLSGDVVVVPAAMADALRESPPLGADTPPADGSGAQRPD